jgi:hypothetical protein
VFLPLLGFLGFSPGLAGDGQCEQYGQRRHGEFTHGLLLHVRLLKHRPLASGSAIIK